MYSKAYYVLWWLFSIDFFVQDSRKLPKQPVGLEKLLQVRTVHERNSDCVISRLRDSKKLYVLQGSSARLVVPAILALGQTEGLAGNSKPIYEVCDSKSEKSAPMYCFEGTPLHYNLFAWIVRLTNLAQ